MADKSFGVDQLDILGTGTPTISAPNQLNLDAHTVAISTSVTVGEGMSAVNISATGISTIAQPANSNPMANWTITNNSASAYRFTGPGQSGSDDNPDLYLVRGHRYIFKHNATTNHPIQIRVANGGAAYTDGITYSDTGNNRTTDGNNLIINLQHDAPARLFYQCTAHGGMVGNIYTVGGPQVISGVVTATTFVGNLTGNVTGTASANAVLTGSTNNQLVTVTGANAITGESSLTFDGNNLNFTRATAGDARMYIYGGEGGDARLLLASDEGDDHIDTYEFRAQAADNALALYQFESGSYQERLRVKNGGDIGIGVASPDGRVHIMGGNLGGAGSVTANSAGNLLVLESNQSNGMSLLNANDERANIYFGTTGTNGDVEAGIQYAHENVSTTADRRAMIFRAGGADRARIQSGKLIVGRTNSITVSSDPTDHNFEQLTNNGCVLGLHCDQNDQRGIGLFYTTGKSPSDAFRYVVGSSAKFLVLGNGNCQNANNTYTNISDATLKENIVDANSQWNDIKNIKIRNYNFKASTGYETHTQIGVIAQEVESVAPKLVDSSGKDGIKSVASSVLYMKAVKALQESMARIETLEAKVAALEGS